MTIQSVIIIAPLLLAGIISFSLLLYTSRRLTTPGAPIFAVLLLSLIIWSLGYAIELTSQELRPLVFWAKLQYAGIVTIPTVWFLLSVKLSGNDKLFQRSNLLLFTIMPVVTLLLAWTTERHGLIWQSYTADFDGPITLFHSERGFFFWVHTVYSYLLLTAGFILLIQLARQKNNQKPSTTIILLASAFAPWIGNALFLASITQIDTTPFFFALSSLGVAGSVLQFSIFELLPIGQNAAFNNILDGVVLLNNNGEIVHTNPTALTLLETQVNGSPIAGKHIAGISPALADLLANFHQESPISREINLATPPTNTILSSTISPLRNRQNKQKGYLLLMRDITAQKTLESHLLYQNELFENLVTVAPGNSKWGYLERDVAKCVRHFCHINWHQAL